MWLCFSADVLFNVLQLSWRTGVLQWPYTSWRFPRGWWWNLKWCERSFCSSILACFSSFSSMNNKQIIYYIVLNFVFHNAQCFNMIYFVTKKLVYCQPFWIATLFWLCTHKRMVWYDNECFFWISQPRKCRKRYQNCVSMWLSFWDIVHIRFYSGHFEFRSSIIFLKSAKVAPGWIWLRIGQRCQISQNMLSGPSNTLLQTSAGLYCFLQDRPYALRVALYFENETVT